MILRVSNNKLPQGWVECQLEDILSNKKYSIKRGPFGSSLKKTYFVQSGIRVFEQYNPINNDPYWARYYITESKYKELEAFTAKAGDFLVSCSGTLGKILQLPVDVEMGIINQALLKITVNNDLIDSEFFINLFQSPKFQKNILDNTIGTAIQNIASVKELKKIRILLPPLNEQRRIVEKIESEFAKIDEGLEHLEQAKEQIKQYRQSVLKSAFLINNKNEKCLDEITNKINDGTHKTPTYIEKGIPFISVKDIRNKQIFFDNCKYISEDEHQILFKRCNPEYGDVLITKSGTIGRTAIVNTNKVFDLFVSVALLKPKKDLISSEFLMYALDNYIAHIDIKQEVKGGVIKNLHIEDLKKIAIYLPPLGEQKKIVEEIEKRFSVADEVERVVEENIEKAKQLKQSILKKAFEGRLVPQDPTDEPASILLEKIKQERSKK